LWQRMFGSTIQMADRPHILRQHACLPQLSALVCCCLSLPTAHLAASGHTGAEAGDMCVLHGMDEGDACGRWAKGNEGRRQVQTA
jgi:hypothetical protein